MIVTPYTWVASDNDFGATVSNTKLSGALVAVMEANVTVPGASTESGTVTSYKRFKSVMRCTADFWFANNATAVVGIGAITATDSELNPPCREVKAGDVLSFISTAGGELSIALYAIN